MDLSKVEVGEIFTIGDEHNVGQDVEVLGVINIEGTDYAAVGFVEDLDTDSEEDIEIYFLRVAEDGTLTEIESDEEFDKVTKVFDEMMSSEVEE